MTTKQLTRLVGVLVIVLLVWGGLALARGSGTDSAGGFTFPTIDTATVDTIALTAPSDSELLARDARGRWTVNGYAADPGLVSTLLRAFDDSTTWSELVAEQRSSHGEFGVAADSARRVRVVSHGKPVLDVVTGNRTNGARGIYMRLVSADPVYAVHGPLVDALDHHTVNEWRNKQIAAVPSDSVSAIRIQRGAKTYELKKKDSMWSFASGAAADSAAVSRLLSAYADVRASGFATPDQADSANFTKARLHAQLLGANGTPRVNLAFDSTASDVWARADSAGPVYRVDSWRLSDLLPTEKSLHAKSSAAKKK